MQVFLEYACERISTISSAAVIKYSEGVIIQFLMEMEKHPPLLALSDLQLDQHLSARYQFLQEVGSGNFTRVFKVVCKRNGSIIALKTESILKSQTQKTLAHQYHLINKLQGRLGVPKVFQFGEWSGGSYLEMQLFTERLESRAYSLGEINDIALQLLRIAEGLHSAGVLHQDLQPNKLMRSENRQVYVVGFGRAKVIPIRKHPHVLHPFTGNYMFASLRAHSQAELGKKDDLEALFYTLAHLYYRKLPWSRLLPQTDHKLNKIKQLKNSCRDGLYTQMGLPFVRAFQYITALESYADPDYAQLKSYFKRRRTVALEKRSEIERSKAKKLSLDLSFFAPFLEEACDTPATFTFGKIDDNRKKQSQTNSNQNSQTSSRDENFTSQENIEPSICKPIRSIALKNPFFN